MEITYGYQAASKDDEMLSLASKVMLETTSVGRSKYSPRQLSSILI